MTVALFAVGCGVLGGGANGKSEEPAAKTGTDDAPETNVEQTEPSVPAQPQTVDSPSLAMGPDGEILANLMGARITLKEGDGGPDEMPQDRDGLLKAAKKALGERNTDYALAIIDVLNIMNPNDPEILELRGNAMMEQGLKEDAEADLDKCCSLGRSSCCR